MSEPSQFKTNVVWLESMIARYSPAYKLYQKAPCRTNTLLEFFEWVKELDGTDYCDKGGGICPSDTECNFKKSE